MATTIEELQVLITSETGDLRRELGRVRRELGDMDNAVSKSTNAMKKAFAGVAAALATLGIVKYVKDAIMATSALENAFMGLQSIVEGQGRSFARAKGFINEYIADGLVPLTNAVTAYKNLAARGYSDEQIEITMNRLKDAASFGRQASYSLGDAITTATEGLKNENSILVDNAGVTKNVAKMWDDYAKSIGTTANNLTKQQKIQAEVSGIMEETKFQVGDAALYADTFAGRLAYLNKTLSDIQGNIGAAFMPVANAVIPILQRLAEWVLKVTAYFKYFMQAFFGVSKSTGSTKVSMDSGTESQVDFGNAAADAGKKATGAGKATEAAAKKAKGALLGFDEINQLTMSEPTGSSGGSGGGGSGGGGSGGGGGGGGIDIVDDYMSDEMDTETIPQNIQDLVDRIKGSFEDLKSFMGDFGGKFGDAFSGLSEAIQPLRDAVEPIKQSFLAIGRSFLQLIDEYIKPLAGYLLFDFIPSIVTGIVRDFAPVLADVSIWGMDLAARALQTSVEMMVSQLNDVLLPSLEAIKTAFLEASTSIATSLQSLLDGTIKPLVEFLLLEFLLPVGDTLLRTLVPIFTDTLVFAIDLTAKSFQNFAERMNELTSSTILPALQTITDAFLNFVPSVGQSLQTLLDGTIKPFADYLINDFALPIADELLAVFVPIFADTIAAAFEVMAETFDWAANLMNDVYKSVIKPTFDLVKKIVLDTLKIIEDTWDKYGKDHLKSLKDLFENVRDLFQTLWDKVLKPIVEPFIKKLTELWDNHIKGLVKQIGELVSKLVSAATEIFNKFVSPIIKFLVEALAPGFVQSFNLIMDVVMTVIGVISDLIASYMKVLGGLLDFVKGVFTGDWRTAWQGISDIFGGIIGGISSIFRGVINILIDLINSFMSGAFNGINTVIRSAANVANAIPGVNINVGTISAPRIPKLARGGIVDGATNMGNYIAGEAGKEMVIPLENTPFIDKLASALGTAVMAAMTMSQSQSSNANQGDLIINLDGTALGRILSPYMARETQRIGGAIIQPI